MAALPAKCRSCGLVFPIHNLIGGSGAGRVTFAGSVYRPCPSCGGTADILDGEYKLVDDVLELLSGPASTWDALRQAAEIVRVAKAAGQTDEQAIEAAAKVLPSLRALKGGAKSALVWFALVALAKVAEYYVIDPLIKPAEPPPHQLRQIIKDALAEAEQARASAEKAAGLIEARPTAPTVVHIPLESTSQTSTVSTEPECKQRAVQRAKDKKTTKVRRKRGAGRR